jgi:hypothetical protein
MAPLTTFWNWQTQLANKTSATPALFYLPQAQAKLAAAEAEPEAVEQEPEGFPEEPEPEPVDEVRLAKVNLLFDAMDADDSGGLSKLVSFGWLSIILLAVYHFVGCLEIVCPTEM